MKFSKWSQLFLVSSIGLLVATILTACQIVTIDYLFVASSAGSGTDSAGQINVFAVDAESGALRTGATTVESGGVSPVAMATTSDYYNLYVANQGNNSVVHFSIASNGVLTKKDTITTSFTPASIAVNAAGTYLFVVGGTNPSELATYAISSGTIGSLSSLTPLTVPSNTSDLLVPTGVTVLADNSAVYVTAYDKSAYNPGGSTSSTANPGWIFGFKIGSGGALTVPSGSPWEAGVKPSGLAADPTYSFLYVTDYASNQMIAYTIQSTGILNSLINGPFKTGNEPSAIVVDPRGKYIYVTNALDATVSAYAIDLQTGTPTITVNATGSGANTTETQPSAIIVDPALGRFVYTANYLANSISGFRLTPDTGALQTTQATPYPTGSKPIALIAVPHGNHSVQATTR